VVVVVLAAGVGSVDVVDVVVGVCVDGARGGGDEGKVEENGRGRYTDSSCVWDIYLPIQHD